MLEGLRVESLWFSYIYVKSIKKEIYCHNVAEDWMNMTEQPSNNPQPVPERLLIDDPSNFQYHAAYLVYSDLFDSVKSAEAKAELNRTIDDLKQSKIDPETFYRNVARYRGGLPERRHDRLTVQTQRKKDWRMKSQKQDRIRRHKK